MKKLLLLTIAFSCHQLLFGQQEVTEKTFEEQINHIFARLDTRAVTTGFLIDRGNPFFNFHEYQASKSNYYLENFDEFTAAYASLQTAKIPSKSATPNWFHVEAPNYTKEVRQFAQNDNTSLPIAIILHDYNYIKPQALESQLVTTNNKQLIVQESSAQTADSSQIYATATAFLAQSVKRKLESAGPNIVFTFPKILWFSEAKYVQSTLQFDPGDGRGYRSVRADTRLAVSYKIPGSQMIKFKWTNPVNGEVHEQYNFVEVQWTSDQFPAAYNNSGDLVITGSEVGHARVVIDYGESSNFRLDRPIIIAEGFDPSDKIDDDCTAPLQDYDYFFREKLEFQDLLPFRNNLQNDSYDIVHIDFASSTQSFESNAEVVKKVIRYVNSKKLTRNGIKEKNITMGLSMGGVVMRYALRDMEQNGEDHDSRLYISFDSRSVELTNK